MAEIRSDVTGLGLRLLLRPWDTRDIPRLLDVYRDPVTRQSSRNPITTEQDARRWLEGQRQGWLDGRRLSFAVLGSEYWTAPSARNRGTASEAVKLLTAWAFENFGAHGLRRIELLHQQDNLASCRVAQKSGYALIEVLPADPPAFPLPGHLHVRYSAGPIHSRADE